MPPEPVSSFTIPSIHDDTPLDCRVYHPAKLTNCTSESVWQKGGAVIAHPYAPLGGCYDDPVVLSAVTELLKLGFVVGTFNFRGAGSSKGRTSWTAKPELSDYVSFAGFLIYYVAGLDPPAISQTVGSSQRTTSSTLCPIQSALQRPGEDPNAGIDNGMILILGGYSYGSLVVGNLPSTETILSLFATVSKGTAEAEIRLRAMHLSNQWNAEAQQHSRRGRRSAQSTLRASPHSAVFGGEESEPGTRRASRESRRSMDIVRRSMERSRTKLGIRRSSSGFESPPSEVKVGQRDLDPPSTHYLLISPLLPPVSMFATMFSKAGGFRNEGVHQTNSATTTAASCAEDKFQKHPTLAIYGDKDFFTSHKKLRKWAERLMAHGDSRFTCREIKGAGHFWHEDGVDGQLRGCIRGWVVDIVGGQATTI